MRTKTLSRDEIKRVVEELSEPHVSAVGLFASYLRALEEAEEDAWAEANAAQLLAEFKAAEDEESLVELNELISNQKRTELG